MARESSGLPRFENVCRNAAKILASCEGYFIDRISFDIVDGHDALEIGLRQGPEWPDVTISLSGVHHLSIGKPPESSGCFVDEVSVIHAPASPHPWPEGLVSVRRHDGLPELAWIRLIGPMDIEAVASTLTVFTAMSDDAAAVRPEA
ncbi:hypothetical protein [Actinomadura alba]|uniref:Uncharacterized protein n=1 Tax=Actinomadura alba TaxID=406431 RepID=A0ABR7LPK9_9ACTN|nr:hypothetical protein [Actinomadura alba]MBC6466435.1 hypothetical protein [Actinomadura alba]